MAGDPEDPENLLGIPLSGAGWLWSAGPNIGVHLLVPKKGGRRALALRAKRFRGLPGWREQTHAEDALLGWIRESDWTPAWEAELAPTRDARIAVKAA